MFKEYVKEYVDAVKGGLRGPLYEMSVKHQIGAAVYMWGQDYLPRSAANLYFMYHETGKNKNTLEAFSQIVDSLSERDLEWLQKKLDS